MSHTSTTSHSDSHCRPTGIQSTFCGATTGIQSMFCGATATLVRKNEYIWCNAQNKILRRHGACHATQETPGVFGELVELQLVVFLNFFYCSA
mmetsp:Transcript_5132/g.11325  ORF Transcript_5132/g.11325 Transcript_5132/m.11325 type:complete len:93 (+) Transcript_5132:3631-3909(+)